VFGRKKQVFADQMRDEGSRWGEKREQLPPSTPYVLTQAWQAVKRTRQGLRDKPQNDTGGAGKKRPFGVIAAFKGHDGDGDYEPLEHLRLKKNKKPTEMRKKNSKKAGKQKPRSGPR